MGGDWRDERRDGRRDGRRDERRDERRGCVHCAGSRHGGAHPRLRANRTRVCGLWTCGERRSVQWMWSCGRCCLCAAVVRCERRGIRGDDSDYRWRGQRRDYRRCGGGGGCGFTEGIPTVGGCLKWSCSVRRAVGSSSVAPPPSPSRPRTPFRPSMPPVTTPLPVDGCTVTTFDRFGDSRG